MIELMKKDFKLLKKSLLIIFLFLPFLYIVVFIIYRYDKDGARGFFMGYSSIIIYLTPVSMIFSLKTFDYKSSADKLILSLSCTRTEIVSARYILCVLISIVNFIITFIFLVIFSHICNIESSRMIISIFYIGFCSLWLLGITAPIYYKLKNELSNIIMFITYFISGILCELINDFFDIKKFLKMMSSSYAILATLLITLIILKVSMALSIRFYSKREF